jgi:hypothetical protein
MSKPTQILKPSVDIEDLKLFAHYRCLALYALFTLNHIRRIRARAASSLGSTERQHQPLFKQGYLSKRGIHVRFQADILNNH